MHGGGSADLHARNEKLEQRLGLVDDKLEAILKRAEATLATLEEEQCTLLYADTHTLKALHAEQLAGAVAAADLAALRGGVCKVGSGSDFLDGTLPFAGIELSTLGKRA